MDRFTLVLVDKLPNHVERFLGTESNPLLVPITRPFSTRNESEQNYYQ